MRRLIQSVIVLFLVSIIIFMALRILPGDPLRLIITLSDSKGYTEIELQQLRHQYGMDRPLVVQYFSWLGALFRGDMGRSIFTREPVTNEILRRLPITFHIGVITFIIGIVVGVPAGIISALRRGTWLDQLVITLSNLGITIPNFWLGLLLVYLFGLYLRWLPIMGYTSPFVDFGLGTKQIIMPVICLALFSIASLARQTRSSMLDVLHQDYIRTAWSKGLAERMVVIRHALKNGLIPVITLSGMSVPMIVGGAVVVETVFNIPGMGRLAVNAIQTQDYPYVQAVIMVVSAVVLLTNLLVDISYGWADPRIRLG